MRTKTTQLVATVALIALRTQAASAAEEKIKPGDLPKGVAESIQKRFPESKIRAATRANEHGEIVYDIELTWKDRKYESDVKESGVIMEIEKEIPAKDWPKALAGAVEAKLPGTKIKEVMEVDRVTGKEEKPDHLEVTLEIADKKERELVATLDGKTLSEEAADEESVSSGQDEEEKVEVDKLPAPVLAAVSAKFPKAKLLDAEVSDEEGKKIYEVSAKIEKQAIDIAVTPEGKILSVEKEIATKDLPKPVADALAATYPHATVKRVEEVVEEDKLTGYEVSVTTADNKSLGVTFDPAGKVVEEE